MNSGTMAHQQQKGRDLAISALSMASRDAVVSCDELSVFDCESHPRKMHAHPRSRLPSKTGLRRSSRQFKTQQNPCKDMDSLVIETLSTNYGLIGTFRTQICGSFPLIMGNPVHSRGPPAGRTTPGRFKKSCGSSRGSGSMRRRKCDTRRKARRTFATRRSIGGE